MVWKLGVEKLDEAVAFVGASDNGQLVAENLDAVVPLLVDEAAFAGRWCDETVDGGAIGGNTGSDRKGRAIHEDNTSETDNGNVEGSEVATKPRSDAARVVGAKSAYGSSHDSFGGENKSVVGIYRVD